MVAPRLDDFVEQHLAALRSYTEVLDLAMAKFHVAERTVATSIARVRAGWKAAAGAELEDRRATFLAELAQAWRSAAAVEDFRAVAMLARTRADVLGVRTPTKVELGGTVGLRPVAAMSPKEREQEIQVLLAKRAAALGEPPPALPTFVSTNEEAEDVIEAETTARRPKTRAKRKPRVH